MFPSEIYIAEVLIYRCTEERFWKQYERDLAAHQAKIVEGGGVPEMDAPETYARSREHFIKNYGGPWRYNQIVGCIRIYALGRTLRGELWLSDATRFRRLMKNKHIHLVGKAFEMACWPEQTSADISENLLKILREEEKTYRRRGLALDLTALQGIGSYVDWRAIVGLDD